MSDSVLCREGEPVKYAFCLLSGSVTITSNASERERKSNIMGGKEVLTRNTSVNTVNNGSSTVGTGSVVGLTPYAPA